MWPFSGILYDTWLLHVYIICLGHVWLIIPHFMSRWRISQPCSGGLVLTRVSWLIETLAITVTAVYSNAAVHNNNRWRAICNMIKTLFKQPSDLQCTECGKIVSIPRYSWRRAANYSKCFLITSNVILYCGFYCASLMKVNDINLMEPVATDAKLLYHHISSYSFSFQMITSSDSLVYNDNVIPQKKMLPTANGAWIDPSFELDKTQIIYKNERMLLNKSFQLNIYQTVCVCRTDCNSSPYYWCGVYPLLRDDFRQKY